MTSSDLTRYSCQVALPGFGSRGQALLQNAKVLIIGAGGLGCPAAQYLVSSGIGTIGIVDNDTISISNLHRQILFTPTEEGRKKAVVACEKLQLQNPACAITAHEMMLNTDNALELVSQYDIVLDCTDNFDTKYLLNDACVIAGKPLVYAAIYQYEGQVAIWNAAYEDGSRSTNYRDVFPEANAALIPNCAEGGVLPTLAGIIGCMQANETIKFITKTGEPLVAKMLVFDALTLQTQTIKTAKVTKTNITALPVIAPPISISADELRKDIRKYELIDVRTSDEHKFFNIGGKNIPLSEIAENLSYLSANKPIVFYCATGQRSAEAVKMIKKRFDAELYSLEGGLKGWG
jgi:molybdopterin/thiamine biosynthesis adenylyltransferase/rhodanese-related sulfurtransferase